MEGGGDDDDAFDAIEMPIARRGNARFDDTIYNDGDRDRIGRSALYKARSGWGDLSFLSLPRKTKVREVNSRE